MKGPLADILDTRTEQDKQGTIRSEWDHILFWRDMDRFIEEGLVERAGSIEPTVQDFRERQCFRELGTGDIYVYIAGWERGSPEFRKLIE